MAQELQGSRIAHYHCVIHVWCLTCPCLLSLPSVPWLHRQPPTFLWHDEHLGPYERSHCDDLRQSGGFTQTVTPTWSLWSLGTLLSSGWEGVPRCRGSWLKNASTVWRQFRSPNASVSTAMCRAQPRTQHQLALEWSHDLQSTCLGSEDTTSHLQASHEAGGHRTRTTKFQRKSWRKMGLPSRTKSGLLWPGPFTKVMSQFCRLFVPFWGGELPLGGEAEPLGRMAWDSRCRNCNSTNSLLHNHSWCGRYDSKIKWLPYVIFHRMPCCGSKKLRWWFLWTSLNPRDQIV